jgi:hypothetical protein
MTREAMVKRSIDEAQAKGQMNEQGVGSNTSAQVPTNTFITETSPMVSDASFSTTGSTFEKRNISLEF